MEENKNTIHLFRICDVEPEKGVDIIASDGIDYGVDKYGDSYQGEWNNSPSTFIYWGYKPELVIKK